MVSDGIRVTVRAISRSTMVEGGVHALVEQVHTILSSDTSRHKVLKVLSRKVAVNGIIHT